MTAAVAAARPRQLDSHGDARSHGGQLEASDAPPSRIEPSRLSSHSIV